MEFLNDFVNTINGFLWSYVLVVVLVGCGLWFTFSTRFVQLRMLPDMLRLLTEGVGEKKHGGAISSFQAFCVSTASRVGVGNIAGVAIAIVTGGPGSVFWMWVIAFIGCATGFVESTLAQIYKLPKGNGTFHGGPAYYIKNALHQPGVAKLFAFLISVTFGLIYVSVQANTIALSAKTAFGIAPIVTAIFLCVLTALVIFGGMSRIARAEILKIKEREYILASRTLGAKSLWIIFQEGLPNMIGPLITQTMFSIPHAIFTEAFLAFIGLGVPEPMSSLGSLISSGYKNFTTHPYMIVAPMIIMCLLILSFTLFADGLRDALDPKMKEM